MRLLVVGGEYDERKAMRVFDEYELTETCVVITGGDVGVESTAYNYCVSKGIPVYVLAANHRTYTKLAYPKRNERMVTMRPDLVLAFPGGQTDDVVTRAERWGIEVHLVESRATPVNIASDGSEDIRAID
jgi:hypothetical protein